MAASIPVARAVVLSGSACLCLALRAGAQRSYGPMMNLRLISGERHRSAIRLLVTGEGPAADRR